ncbi:MAG TPA: aspartate aminotransferase family protein [Spirochaetota bacterium]|nr:aspartate aminotransferase family protein [Spirochaetota bacterium]HOL56135.1 aspartate aminotransferase family protein [Spirochaetota bacterium]HPP03367.1 aspartate aminotransferase family protein [Spirochaetota bacterium]
MDIYNNAIIEDYNKYILNTYKRFPLTFVKGEGCYLYTDFGKKMLDFGSGIAVSILGHSHPEIVKTIKEQAENLIHTSNLYYSLPQINLAKKLIEKSIFSKVFFCNSGAEANEAALKLARKYGKIKGGDDKYKVISLKNSFHGRTIATITLTGQTKYQKGFEPLLEGVIYVEPNDINELEKTFDKNVCAIFIEVIQGEGGIKELTYDFVRKIRQLCNDYDALMIVDEIQTGMGRTGKLFGYENFYNIEPDVITLAKGLAAGLPIGAMLLKESFASILGPGDHSSTFGGNLLSTSVASTVLDIIEKENILENVIVVGKYFKNRLLELKEKYPSIVNIRGMGLMLGMELNFSNRDFINKLFDEGIITIPSGDYVVRFLPPLIITKKEVDIVIDSLNKVLGEIK